MLVFGLFLFGNLFGGMTVIGWTSLLSIAQAVVLQADGHDPDPRQAAVPVLRALPADRWMPRT